MPGPVAPCLCSRSKAAGGEEGGGERWEGGVQGPGDTGYYGAWDEPGPEDEADAHAGTGAAFKVRARPDP
jgi:hypothetical protein